MTRRRIGLVFDVGPESGWGHRRRMESLASALADFGLDADLVASGETFGPASLVVVDSYTVRADEPGRFRAERVAAIDDLERNLAVDLLVDPNPGGDPARRSAATATLIGPAHALVGPAPLDLARPTVASTPSSVLVTLGAADGTGLGAEIAARLARLLPEVEVRLVVGPWGAPAPPGVAPVNAPEGLWSELAAADLVVTAGGVTMLESLLIGRPTLVVVTAQNQMRAAHGAAESGAAALVPPGAGPDDIADAAMLLTADACGRRSLAELGPIHVDGRGPSRVARALHALV